MEIFEKPKMEIICFDSNDIITASSCDTKCKHCLVICEGNDDK